MGKSTGSIEALWTVEFISDKDKTGGGVAIFETGRIFGGDSCYYYIGDYTVGNNHHVVGTVRVTHHHGQMYSIFGEHKQFTLKLSGLLQTPEMSLQGSMVEDNNSKIAVKCIRRADLP